MIFMVMAILAGESRNRPGELTLCNLWLAACVEAMIEFTGLMFWLLG